jgi:hypothetical protein
MYRRYLQEDGQGVLWHDRSGGIATLWNFVEREVQLPGKVRDVTDGEDLMDSKSYTLQPCHTYRIAVASEPLPRALKSTPPVLSHVA